METGTTFEIGQSESFRWVLENWFGFYKWRTTTEFQYTECWFLQQQFLNCMFSIYSGLECYPWTGVYNNSRTLAARRATKRSPIPIWKAKGNTWVDFLMVIMASAIARGCIRTTATTESCNMAAIIQIKAWQTSSLGLLWMSLILDIHVMINWHLSKQGICWPTSHDHIMGSGV